MRWIVGIAGAMALVVAVPDADAGRIAITETRAEADLAEQAGAVTLLLRAALDRPGRAVVPAHELRATDLRLDVPASVAPALAALGADGAIACDLVREGTGLRASILAVDTQGHVVAAGTARAGDGDVVGLVTALARIAAPLAGADVAVPSVSVGQLRPFVGAADAIRDGDLAAAARALASAEPLVAVKVPSIGVTLRPGWAGAAADQPTALAIALAAGTPQDILELAPGHTPRARAARALARLAGSALDAAEDELRGRGRDPWLDVAAARLAYLRGDRAAAAAAVRRLLASPQPFPRALVLVSALPAGAIPDALEDAALVQARTDPAWSRLASAIALHVAPRDPSALAAIRVIDLDAAELAQLEPIVQRAAAAGARDGLRLAAELATRRADPVATAEAIDRWRAADAGDPAAALVRGRLALAAARLDEARDAFTAARAEREQARVAIARRDWPAAARLLAAVPDDSVEKQLVAAQLALAGGELPVARVSIERARRTAPANADALRLFAAVLDRAGEKQPAVAAIALAERLAPLDAATAGAGAGPAVFDPSDPRTTVALDPTGAGARPPAAALADELAPMIATLQLPPRATVALVGVRPPAPGWTSLREAAPGPVLAALADALTDAGYFVAGGPPAWVEEPLDPVRLDAALGDLAATHVIVYRLRTDGTTAKLRLTGLDRATDTGLAVDRTLPAERYGLVAWNRDRIVVLGIAGVVLVALLAFWFVRGARGRLVVNLTLDPDGSDEALAIELSRVARRPQIPDPARFRKDLVRAGHVVTAHGARLPGSRTVFKVVPGPWFVHVYGVYTRELGDRVVPPMHSHKVDVARGATQEITVDLGLPVAEVKVTIHDARRAGIAVWLDHALADKVYTDADGQATLYATVGTHTLHVDATDLRIERPLPIAAAQIEKVLINLPRERRLAEVSGGLSLGPGIERVDRSSPMDLVTAEPAPAASPVRRPSGQMPAVRLTPTSPPQPAAAFGAAAAAAAAVTVPASPPALAGEPAISQLVLGRYRIDGELGRGAMGVVFKAWDTRLDRDVAVKILARAVREIPDALTFFVQEAKALAQLNHPNVVAVYDQASDGTEHYMIMEYVDGITVEKLLTDRGRLTLRPALGLIDQLCAGLGYAHGRKIIHRDIKPANIFVSREKTVKLGDFGLARVMREIEIRQTDVRGTPLYMAPEQVLGTNINHRADLYAVGCTLFELCAGRPPFIDGNILHHHVSTPAPRLSHFVPEVPAALDDLVAACLVKDAADRIESAAAIQEAVRAIAAAL